MILILFLLFLKDIRFLTLCSNSNNVIITSQRKSSYCFSTQVRLSKMTTQTTTPAKFASQKYQEVRKVIESEPKDTIDGKTFRQRCIARIITEVGMTDHGASTYYSNMAAHLGITAERTSKASSSSKIVSAKDLLGEVDTENLPDNVRNMELYSMVTVDKNRIAIDVRCFSDKAACLDKCNTLEKHFIKGHQKRGCKLGTLVGQRVPNFDYQQMLPN